MSMDANSASSSPREPMAAATSPFTTPELPVTSCRLIVDPPRLGALNMAIDELLLQQAIDDGIATLRFYQWSEPTLSLGYFQSHEDRKTHAASRDCAVVRRSTGGGAIVHDQELTYSLATPVASASRIDHSNLVNLFHQTISELLAEAGLTARPICCDEVPPSSKKQPEPFLCFQRRERGDVVTAADANKALTEIISNPTSQVDTHPNSKLVGSAQRRRHGAILQHGSLLLAQSEHAPELDGCVEFGADSLDISSLTARWATILADRLSLTLQPAEIEDSLLKEADQLAASKFASPAWLSRR